ncbi:hypothetical protein LCGC14_2946700, partial [marine sediment metagenome]
MVLRDVPAHTRQAHANCADVFQLYATARSILCDRQRPVSKVKAGAEIKEGTDNFFSMWKDELRSLKKTNVDKIDWFP